jgi:hypothetical protein
LGGVKKISRASLLSSNSIEFNFLAADLIRARKGPFMDRNEQQFAGDRILSEALALVGEALSRLRYGAIQLTVHDGKVMQIDVTERKRLAD